MGFDEAWAAARKSFEGVTRLRVPGQRDGIELAALDWGGQGELALLHHANGFCGATLAPVARALSSRFRVIAIDARGHGDSTPVRPESDPDAYAWTALVDDLDAAIPALLERVGRASVALAIGHSFGGALLLRAASVRPVAFERLLLCDPVLHARRRQGAAPTEGGQGMAAVARKRRDRFPSFGAAYDHFRSRGLFRDFTPEALALYAGEGLRETDDGGVTLKCAREIEAAVFEGRASGVCAEGVESVTARTLFVHAGRGSFEATTYEALASRMPDARVMRRDLGHLFPMEAPETVLALVDDLMTES